uniref:Skin mucus lectin n=1 Tax=Lophiomus setigerus TaxID=292417 RepID=Q5DWD7_LOPSE|nr:skin mucus lectin [Lophiomus setigerus]
MSRNYMSKNDELRAGDYLMSNNGEWKAVFQDNGNFVIYGWTPTWASNTCEVGGYRLCLQQDCNLVMYDMGGKAVWHTNSSKSAPNMCRLQLTDKGSLVVYREGESIWKSED